MLQIVVNSIVPLWLACLVWWYTMVTIRNYDYHALACSGEENTVGVDLVLLVYWLVDVLPLQFPFIRTLDLN